MPSNRGRGAADFELRDIEGRTYRSSDFRGHWALLVFHRHLAWLPCREHLSQLRQQTDEMDRLGIKVCVVTFEREFLVRAYMEETGTAWPILIDENRELYLAYGMERGRASDILGLRSWWTYAKLLLRGRRLKRGEGDIYQLGGDVLVDPDGIVRLHHVGNGPADRPAVSAILDVIRESGTTE